jgi:hypothetical protein
MRKLILEKSLLVVASNDEIYVWLKPWLKLLFNQKDVIRYLVKTMVEIIV